MRFCRSQGNTVAEYALISGIVIFAVMGGLIFLGDGIRNAFTNFGASLDNRDKQPQSGLVVPYNQQSSNLPGTNHNIVVNNPNGAKPLLEVLDHVQATVTVAGVDGTRENSLGSLMVANTFDQLAKEETDPQSSDYVRQLAQLSYYLGAVEGNVDGVQNLLAPKVGNVTYNSANAISDIYTFNAKMKKLLANTPATMDDRTRLQLAPLAAEVTKISKSYLDHYRGIIKDGKVNSFVPVRAIKGDGEPGSSLDKPVGFYWYLGTRYSQPKSYNDIVSYDEVKAKAAGVLADNNAAPVKVVTTLTDAQKTDHLANQFEQLNTAAK